MQTKRDWLVSKGLAKPGRGKFSNAAKEALAKAEAEGVKFSDAVVPTKNATAPKPTGNPTKNSDGGQSDRKTDAGMSAYLFPSDFRYPEDEYKAVGTDGKTYSMRECCNTCRVSLTNHACNTPTIHGNMVVHIRERR